MRRFETITKSEQAANHLRRQVLTGVLVPGQRIPSERTLCKEYALSRVTINKITSTLVQDGLLERRGPSGTFVVGINGKPATLQIGFLMRTNNPHEVNPIYESVLRALVRASHTRHSRVVFGMLGTWGETLPPGFNPTSLDALVLAGDAPAEQVAAFTEARKPVVWVDEVDSADVRSLICTDNLEAGRMAADHLLARGRRAIVAMGYPVGSYRGFELRLEGFRQAHAAHGVRVDERRILRPFYSRVEHVVEILRQLERDGISFDAVFGLCDLIGIWNINALSRLGKRVPEDVAVISVDGMPSGECTHPRLTSIAQPVDEIGEMALARVLAMVESGQKFDAPCRMAPKLLVREST